jgi:predicted ABC-type ATPase
LTNQPQLWLLVGGNGAGKSTFHRLALERLGLPFVNADVLARIAYPEAPEANSYAAARLADQQRDSLLLQGLSFCYETVYSHPAKIDVVARARSLGYWIILVLIHLQRPELNLARVNQRLRECGHHVPDDKVIGRIPRTLEHVRRTIPLVDELRVFANSSAESPFLPMFSRCDGVQDRPMEPLSTWAADLLEAGPDA